jgi:hypothetical protein
MAVKYRDHWFCIDNRDRVSEVTSSMVLPIVRVNLVGVRNGGPVITPPIGR